MLLYNQSCQHNFFPMMSPDEFESLKQDIRANGLRTPVLMYENKVLDGRNRYAACREIGVKPHTIEYVGNDPVGHVISLNLMRRHLSTSQRAMISLRITHYKHGGIRLGQNTLASQTANLPLAILLTHNWTEALWWHQAVKVASAVCFSLDKLPFLDSEGKRERPSNHGQTFVYIGDSPDKFSQAFEQFGTILFCKPG